MSEDQGDDFRALMIAANAGDKDAYARLLHGLTTVVRRIVAGHRRFVGDDATEDVVQEVLLSVHAVRATYNPDRAFMPWLVAITRRRIIDAGRRRMRREGREVELDENDVTFSSGEANADEEASRSALLRSAIDGLPRTQRRAIELLKIRELSLREASAASGLSIGALKVAAHRGMAALRARLKA